METINITDLQAKKINEVGQPVLLEICKNYILSVEDRQILALLQKQITEKKAELVWDSTRFSQVQKEKQQFDPSMIKLLLFRNKKDFGRKKWFDFYKSLLKDFKKTFLRLVTASHFNAYNTDQ